MVQSEGAVTLSRWFGGQSSIRVDFRIIASTQGDLNAAVAEKRVQEAYRDLNYAAEDLPVTEQAAAAIVSLPMFPNLSAAAQSRVSEEVQNFVKSRSERGLLEPQLSR